MSATLKEALVERRRMAGRNAVRAAHALADGTSRDVGAQADLETALADFRNYSELSRELAPVLDELSAYRRGGFSLVADLRKAQSDKDAAARILAHARSLSSDAILENRDLGAGTTWSTIPTWAMEDAGPRSIAASPTVNLLARPMPRNATLDVRLVRLTTAPVAAIQTALNAAIAESDPVDGFATAAVQTAALKVDLSLQLLEQGSQAVDATLLPAVAEAVDSAIGTTFLSALTTLTGAEQQTFVSGTPTLATFWAALEPLIRAVQAARKVGGRPIVVVHPRRLSWIRQRIVTENLAGLELAPPTTEGTTVSIMGSVDLVADPCVTTTNNTNQDVAYVLPARDVVDLFLAPPVVRVSDAGSSTLSGTLTATLLGRRNLAVASRAPAAVGVLQGTGLVAP